MNPEDRDMESLMVLSWTDTRIILTITGLAQRITQYEDGAVSVSGPGRLYSISPKDSKIHVGAINVTRSLPEVILEAAQRQGILVHQSSGNAFRDHGITGIAYQGRTFHDGKEVQ